MVSRIMDPMPNLLLLLQIAATLRQHLRLEATLSSNSSMAPHMANKHQVSDLK